MLIHMTVNSFFLLFTSENFILQDWWICHFYFYWRWVAVVQTCLELQKQTVLFTTKWSAAIWLSADSQLTCWVQVCAGRSLISSQGRTCWGWSLKQEGFLNVVWWQIWSTSLGLLLVVQVDPSGAEHQAADYFRVKKHTCCWCEILSSRYKEMKKYWWRDIWSVLRRWVFNLL